MIYPVIIAGGKGERFWPYSNQHHAKQVLPLITNQSMLEDTLKNIDFLKEKSTNEIGHIYIIISQNLEKEIKRIVQNRSDVVLVVEPEGKNTAPAILLAAKLIAKENEKGVMLVMTADHNISSSEDFLNAVEAAFSLANKGNSLVTFGIKPSRPETGYGYIEIQQNSINENNNLSCYKALCFHEKPNQEKAQEYCDKGSFFWNSGMFIWRIDFLLSCFSKYLPEMKSSFDKLTVSTLDTDFFSQLKNVYLEIDSESIDYGIMEKVSSIDVVVPQYEWDDVGSWSSLERLHAKNENGSIEIGDAINLDSKDCISFSETGLVVLYGVKNLLVVRCEDVTLVMPKDKVQDLKRVLAEVRAKKEFKKYL